MGSVKRITSLKVRKKRRMLTIETTPEIETYITLLKCTQVSIK